MAQAKQPASQFVAWFDAMAGKILLDGQDAKSLTDARARPKGIGYLPQEASIFRRLSVQENLLAVPPEAVPGLDG